MPDPLDPTGGIAPVYRIERPAVGVRANLPGRVLNKNRPSFVRPYCILRLIREWRSRWRTRTQIERPVQLHRPLPLLGSNQDSPDPESGVLPVTPRGSFYVMELRGIEPLTSAVRLQRSPS